MSHGNTIHPFKFRCPTATKPRDAVALRGIADDSAGRSLTSHVSSAANRQRSSSARTSLLRLILLFVSFAASAQSGMQSGMSKAELTQLCTAAGSPIANDQPVDVSGAPARPRVTFVDINGDRHPEALFIDSNARAVLRTGFGRRGTDWRSACDDPGTASYTPGKIEHVTDLNGDGLPEAVITEGGTYCYGSTGQGQGYWLVSAQSNGAWNLVTNGIGIPEFLASRGAADWPDISIGGPGFCFPRRTLERFELHARPLGIRGQALHSSAVTRFAGGSGESLTAARAALAHYL